MVTLDLIINTLKDWVENKKNISPTLWVDAAQKLSTLLFDEYDKLAELQQITANLKLMALEAQEKKNVSEARMRVEASNEYKEMRKQESKIKNVEELIRIAKLQAKLREFGN